MVEVAARLVVICDDHEEEVCVGEEDVGRSVAEVLYDAGLGLNTRCGRRGVCDGCLVEVEDSGRGLEKACGLAVRRGEQRLLVPRRSRAADRARVLDQFEVRVPWAHAPLVTGKIGVAMDLGTTTVAAVVVDLEDGRVLARGSRLNGQVALGEDVLSRINLCGRDEGQVKLLKDAVVLKTLRPLLLEAVHEAGVGLEDVGGVTVAGNTTMLHLLVGEDPSPMGVVPFTPAFLGHRVVTAEALGLCLPGCDAMGVHLLPGVSAYVGADVLGGVLSTGVGYSEGVELLVDVGTNGEMVLACGGRLLGCATAAGPAFEGTGLSCGMRAARGAVERVTMGGDPFEVGCGVIGGAAAEGVCGTGYLDVLALGRATGLLNERGRFSEALPEGAERWVVDHEGVRALRLAEGVLVTEVDVALLLQAKAAIGAGMVTLMELAGVGSGDVDRLYLAGGFGMSLCVEHAIGMGLLPGFEADQVKVVGNSSLASAYLALVDGSVLEELERMRAGVETVELNEISSFEDHYIDGLGLA